jgi:hypothetical protein
MLARKPSQSGGATVAVGPADVVGGPGLGPCALPDPQPVTAAALNAASPDSS